MAVQRKPCAERRSLVLILRYIFLSTGIYETGNSTNGVRLLVLNRMTYTVCDVVP